jgi:hypothetical protein
MNHLFECLDVQHMQFLIYNTTFKLKAKNINCVFVGYNLEYKTYKFIEEST